MPRRAFIARPKMTIPRMKEPTRIAPVKQLQVPRLRPLHPSYTRSIVKPR